MDSILEIQKQCKEDSDKWFPKELQSLAFMTLALCGETGELANLVKKVTRGSHELNEEMYLDICNETVDSLIYLCNLANVLNLNLGAAYDDKRAYNAKRFDSSGSSPEVASGILGVVREPDDEGGGGLRAG